jgi:hypothetical protein
MLIATHVYVHIGVKIKNKYSTQLGRSIIIDFYVLCVSSIFRNVEILLYTNIEISWRNIKGRDKFSVVRLTTLWIIYVC